MVLTFLTELVQWRHGSANADCTVSVGAVVVRWMSSVIALVLFVVANAYERGLAESQPKEAQPVAPLSAVMVLRKRNFSKGYKT